MIVESIRIQGRVIFALMLREARSRYGKTQAGYLWALLRPILHIVAFYTMFTYLGRAAPVGDSIALFLATGLATYLGFRNVLNRTRAGYGSSEALLTFPVVKGIDIFLGRALLELATWVIVTFLILGFLIATGHGGAPESVLTMVGAVLALFSIAFGVGTFLGITSQFVPAINALMKFPMRALYFTSAVFFLPDLLPPFAREVLAWNPILHGITLFRTGYYHLYDSNVLDVKYLTGWAVASMLLALTAERVTRKAIRSLP